MKVLIVEHNAVLAGVWAMHLSRLGHVVAIASSQEEAVSYISLENVDVIVLDLLLEGGSAMAVADYASYRRPAARVVCVTSRSFFSDGSIFAHAPNAAALVSSETPPVDLAAIVEYHGGAA